MKIFTLTIDGVRRFVFLFSALAILFFLSHKVNAQCGNPVFYEGFELGTIAPTWTALGTFSTFAVTVNTVLPHSGNYKLHMTGVSSHLQGIFTNFAPSTPTVASWYIYPYHITGGSNYFVLGDASVSYSHCLVFCCWIGNTSTTGSIRFYSSNTTYTDYPTSNQQWHFIELRNINYVSKTFDIWINNTLFASAFPFRSSTLTNVSQLHLYNLTAVGSSAWDDITIGNGMFASMSAKPPSCHGGGNGSSTITPVGGQAPYTYSWSTSATTSVVTNLSANTVYTAQITDANSCVATKTISLGQPSVITAAFFTKTVTCLGYANGQASVTSLGGTGAHSYTWSTANTGSVASSLAAGTYSVVIMDALGCNVTKTVSIVGPLSTVGASNILTHVKCYGGADGTAFVQGNGGAGGYSYSWIPAIGPGALKINLGAGTYTCIVMDQNACSFPNVITITQPPAITAQVSSNTITCLAQATAVISASGGIPPLTYSWMPGTGTGTTMNNISSGSHTVTVTDSIGCINNFTHSVIQDLQVPSFTVSSSNQFLCKGESAVLSVTGNGDSYLWFNASTTTTIAVTPTVTTDYSVTATNSVNGCTATAIYKQIVNNCSGLNESSMNDRNLHPNPTFGSLMIRSNTAEEFRIFSAEGKLTKEGILFPGENHLDVLSMAPGLYLIIISSDGNKPVSSRFIKQ